MKDNAKLCGPVSPEGSSYYTMSHQAAEVAVVLIQSYKGFNFQQ